MSSLRLNACLDTSHHGPPHPCKDAGVVANSLTGIHNKDISSNFHKCTLPVLIHELNIPEHMLIWPVRLVLACGTRAPDLPAPLSYFLYVTDESFEFRRFLIIVNNVLSSANKLQECKLYSRSPTCRLLEWIMFILWVLIVHLCGYVNFSG
jgi:hypothetical protein